MFKLADSFIFGFPFNPKVAAKSLANTKGLFPSIGQIQGPLEVLVAGFIFVFRKPNKFRPGGRVRHRLMGADKNPPFSTGVQEAFGLLGRHRNPSAELPGSVTTLLFPFPSSTCQVMNLGAPSCEFGENVSHLFFFRTGLEAGSIVTRDKNAQSNTVDCLNSRWFNLLRRQNPWAARTESKQSNFFKFVRLSRAFDTQPSVKGTGQIFCFTGKYHSKTLRDREAIKKIF